MVVCLEQGADLHTAQLMPPSLTVSCFSRIQIGFTFLVLAHPGSPRQSAIKRVCVCLCWILLWRLIFRWWWGRCNDQRAAWYADSSNSARGWRWYHLQGCNVNLNLTDSIDVLQHYIHTHTHLFNGPFSGTTRVSWYQKGKTNLDFTEARDSE